MDTLLQDTDSLTYSIISSSLPRQYVPACTRVFGQQILVFNRRTGVFHLTDGTRFTGQYTYQTPLIKKNVGLPFRLRSARITAGYSQRELASILGVSWLTVSLWETDKRHPSKRRYRLLSTVLGIDLTGEVE